MELFPAAQSDEDVGDKGDLVAMPNVTHVDMPAAASTDNPFTHGASGEDGDMEVDSGRGMIPRVEQIASHAEVDAAASVTGSGKRQKPNKSQRLKKQAARTAAEDALLADYDAAMKASCLLGRRSVGAEIRLRAWRDAVIGHHDRLHEAAYKAARAQNFESDAAAERANAVLETCERVLRTKLNGLNAAVADEERIEALDAASAMRQGLVEPVASVVPQWRGNPLGGKRRERG